MVAFRYSASSSSSPTAPRNVKDPPASATTARTDSAPHQSGPATSTGGQDAPSEAAARARTSKPFLGVTALTESR